MKRIANLIIAGVNKAGTTSLFYYFDAQPDVACSLDKETCYFLPIRYHKPLPPLELYEKQWEDETSALYLLEATPGYFYGGKKMAQAIYNTCGSDTKIILVFRNPVDRLISFYKRKKEMLELPQTFTLGSYIKKCQSMTESDLALEENNLYTGIISGLYSKHINSWFEVFGENLKILFFEDLQSDPKKCMTELCGWLRIDSSVFDSFSFDVKNKSKQFRSMWLHEIAIYMNQAGKRTWRKNERTKKALRKMYHFFNSTPYKLKEYASDDIEYLYTLYEQPNKVFAEYLLMKGIKKLPAWLQFNKTEADS